MALSNVVSIQFYRSYRSKTLTEHDRVQTLCELLQKHQVTMPARHRSLFLSRAYRSKIDLERAIKRYKVFKDLGYGRL